MSETEQQLKELSEIRSLMERSSRFISLSGLSGIAAGLTALIGAAIACWHLGYLGSLPQDEVIVDRLFPAPIGIDWNNFIFLATDAAIILITALGFAYYFTTRNARRNNQKIWDATSQRLLFNLAIPLVTGGILCLILIYHRHILLIAPLTLIFYGLALVNASKYTLDDIRYLGFSEIILGLAGTFYAGHGMIFWIIGFGILHILYGSIMYYRYER